MGTRIHAALAGERVQLNDDENRIADLCSEHEARLVIDTFGPVVMSPVREERLWGYDHRLQRTFSGKPDAVYVHEGRALLIDYKTGRGSVEHASENLQLRALAVLAAEKWEVHDVTVAIIQPMAGHPTMARYRANDLRTRPEGQARTPANGAEGRPHAPKPVRLPLPRCSIMLRSA
jgi:hypothetical protein